MRIVHLTASTLFGGPERQMIGLARALPSQYASSFLSFSEGGRCRPFLGRARAAGFAAEELARDTPHLFAAAREVAGLLGEWRADALVCHGYKSNLIGRHAARRAGVPAVAVARGWTAENAKVRAYEALDRWHLRFMDRVVCVSDGQARKVLAAGVPAGRVGVIRNAARLTAFGSPDPAGRDALRQIAGGPGPVVVAAGRLSPEKGFHVLADAARTVCAADPAVRFVLFGDGVERDALTQQVAAAGLAGRFVLAGFRDDLDRLLPWADAAVLPSFTEGLPNAVLEASAAGLPVVATAVGGTPEVVADGQTGFLVPAGDADALAGRLCNLLRDGELRRRMGAAGRERMRREFTFGAQARAYMSLFDDLARPEGRRAAVAGGVCHVAA